MYNFTGLVSMIRCVWAQ